MCVFHTVASGMGSECVSVVYKIFVYERMVETCPQSLYYHTLQHAAHI